MRLWRRVAVRGAIVCLCLAAGSATFVAVAADAPTDADKSAKELQRAAAPLIDFANWCAKNKAQSAGQAALAEAKKFDPDDPAIATADAALGSASDEAPAMMVAGKRNSAYSAAANNLDRLVTLRSHGGSGDATTAPLQLEAIALSPGSRVFGLSKIGLRAAKAGDTDSAKEAFMLALQLNARDLTSNPNYKQLVAALADKQVLGQAVADAVQATLNDKTQAKLARANAAELLNKVAALDKKGMDSGAYDAATALMDDRLVLIGTANNPSVAYFALPKNWKPGKRYPILLCFPGDGTGYAGIGDGYRNARGAEPFIVLAPVVFCNCNVTNEKTHGQWYGPEITSKETFDHDTAETVAQRLAFDKPGIFALLKAVHDSFGGDKIYVTGFSGGGIACYLTLLQLPNNIGAGAPACANYFMEPPPQHGMGAPVMQLFGQDDPFMDHIGSGEGLKQEGQEGARALASAGYRDVEQKVLPGKSHDPMVGEVMAFFVKVYHAQDHGDSHSSHSE